MINELGYMPSRLTIACRTVLREDGRVGEVPEQPLTGGAQTRGLSG